jgi:hypothetical protein
MSEALDVLKELLRLYDIDPRGFGPHETPLWERARSVVEAGEGFDAFGRGVYRWMRTEQFFFALEVSEDLCEIAQRAGLVEFIKYDPKQARQR